MKKIRLLIIEEHEAVRHALELRLRSSMRVELVAATDSIENGWELIHDLEPDVILFGCKGSSNKDVFVLGESVQNLLEHHIAVIALSPYADEFERELLLQAGISRYLLKDINTPQLINEIEMVAVQRPGSRFHRLPADYSHTSQVNLANGP